MANVREEPPTTESARDPSDAVLLVGSMPFATAEETLRVTAEHLGRDVLAIPDGEVGPRQGWVGYLGQFVYAEHPDLVLRELPEGFVPYKQPDREKHEQEAWQQSVSAVQYELRPGVTDLRLDDIHYGRYALESWKEFQRLQEAGAIGPDVRLQVTLPGFADAIDIFFVPELWERAEAAWEEALAREVAKILEVVPAEKLAIQFDICIEIIDLNFGDETAIPTFPAATYEEKFERYTAMFERLGRAVPDERVLCGYHLCYGTWGGWPMSDMKDLQICTDLANAAVRRTGRRVDYIHMPVVPDPDEAFFAPLAALDVGDTAINLGMIHDADGLDGFRRRAELARRHLPRFGVASVCGYGREDVDNMAAILDLHHACRQALRES